SIAAPARIFRRSAPFFPNWVARSVALRDERPPRASACTSESPRRISTLLVVMGNAGTEMASTFTWEGQYGASASPGHTYRTHERRGGRKGVGGEEVWVDRDGEAEEARHQQRRRGHGTLLHHAHHSGEVDDMGRENQQPREFPDGCQGSHKLW